MFNEEEKLEANLLWKFYHKKFIAGHHCYESNIPKGFPKEIRHFMIPIAKKLVRKGLLEAFPKKREMVYRLNKKRLEEIKKIIKKYYPETTIPLF